MIETVFENWWWIGFVDEFVGAGSWTAVAVDDEELFLDAKCSHPIEIRSVAAFHLHGAYVGQC